MLRVEQVSLRLKLLLKDLWRVQIAVLPYFLGFSCHISHWRGCLSVVMQFPTVNVYVIWSQDLLCVRSQEGDDLL